MIEFIKEQKWIFAKTYAKTAPHEYIVREKCTNEKMFVDFVMKIRLEWYDKKFYSKNFKYLDFEWYTYWTYWDPIETTYILNRVPLLSKK